MSVDTAMRAVYCSLATRGGGHHATATSGLPFSRVRQFAGATKMARTGASGPAHNLSSMAARRSQRHGTQHTFDNPAWHGPPRLRLVDVEVMCAARSRVAIPTHPAPGRNRLSFAAFCLVLMDIAQRTRPHLPLDRRLVSFVCTFLVPYMDHHGGAGLAEQETLQKKRAESRKAVKLHSVHDRHQGGPASDKFGGGGASARDSPVQKLYPHGVPAAWSPGATSGRRQSTSPAR